MCHNGFWHKMTQPKLNNDISLFSLGWVIHLCLVLIKKMHGLRESLVTSVEFSFHYFHVVRFDFALFIFSG